MSGFINSRPSCTRRLGTRGVYPNGIPRIWSTSLLSASRWTLSLMAPSGARGAPQRLPSKRRTIAAKKTHTVKNNLIVDVEERLVRYLSRTYAGSVHDKRICDEEAYQFPPG